MFDARWRRIGREMAIAAFGVSPDRFDPWVLDRFTDIVDEDGHVLAVRKRSYLALPEDDALLPIVEDEIKPRGLHRFHHRVPDPVVGLVEDLGGTGSLGVACISEARRAAGSSECRQNQCGASYRLRNSSRPRSSRGGPCRWLNGVACHTPCRLHSRQRRPRPFPLRCHRWLPRRLLHRPRFRLSRNATRIRLRPRT